MSDKKKRKVQEQDEIEDYARQIWLAGLGAYTRLGKEGSKLFDALIRDGEDAEKLASKGSLDGARSKVEKARKKLVEKLGDWEERFDKSLLGATERLGLASQSELQALVKRVDELSAMVEKLSSASALAAKPARRVSTSKATSAKPKTAAPSGAASKPASRGSSTASKKPTEAAAAGTSSTSAGVKTAPRRRSTEPKAAARGKATPAPATATTPAAPSEQ